MVSLETFSVATLIAYGVLRRHFSHSFSALASLQIRTRRRRTQKHNSSKRAVQLIYGTVPSNSNKNHDDQPYRLPHRTEH